MQYLLLAGLLALFLITYNLCGKDFFAPAVMLVIGFLFSCICAIYTLSGIQYQLHFNTVLLVLSSLTLSSIIGIYVHKTIYRIKMTQNQNDITPIKKTVVIVAIVFVLFVALSLLKEVHRIGGTGSLTEVMLRFRIKNAYSTDMDSQLPFWLRQALNVMWTLFLLLAFHLLRFNQQLSKKEKLTDLVFLGMCILVSMLSGARSAAAYNLIAVVILYHLLGIQQRGYYKTYSAKFILKIILAVLAAAWFFYAIKEVAGRQSDSTLIDYIADYMGNSLINLDLFLKDPPVKSSIWGKETFYSIINFFRKIGLLDLEYYYLHLEFRSVCGHSLGNTYTALRSYYYDFGMVGLILLHSIFTLITSLIYEIVKKKRSDMGILVLAMLYYSIVFYFYYGYFFSFVLSVGFFVKWFMVFLGYQILLKKRGLRHEKFQWAELRKGGDRG